MRLMEIMAASLLPGLMASGSLVFAQTSFGEVNGTVAEQTGAVVPGATVTLINQATNIETTRSTNENGYFTFVNVRPGPYLLKVEAQGFKVAQTTPWALARP